MVIICSTKVDQGLFNLINIILVHNESKNW